jgi:hypothetical protein
MADHFLWACPRDGQPAGERFVIANGKDKLWNRFRSEIGHYDNHFWHYINPGRGPIELSHIFTLLLNQVPTFQINQNKFLLEAAQIPVFAEYIYNHGNPTQLVSNPTFEEYPIYQQPYNENIAIQLARRVERTLKQVDEI